jgi:hypothetical protein
MIRTPSNLDAFCAADRFALAVLIDLARLLPADRDVPDAVQLVVTDTVVPSRDLSTFAARGWFVESADGVVEIPRAVLQQIVAVAGAGTEQFAAPRDRYGRVPSHCNPGVAAGAERTPLVSEAGAALRTAVIKAAGRRPVWTVAPWPDGRRWAVGLTHDLDIVEYWPVFTAHRIVELLRKGDLGLATRVLAAAAQSVARDPVWLGVQEILAVERILDVRSTWFVLCGSPTLATWRAGDITYRADGPKAARILRAIAAGMHEVALHGSFETVENPASFQAQRATLQAMTDGAVAGVRQHYVRMRPGETQRWMAQAGFTYDATFGFPDRNGFRLGVADVVPCWDAAAEQVPGLEEVPFTWMDRAQSKYQGVEDPTAWIDEALRLADACRAAEGVWVGVWHPNLTDALGFPGARIAYRRLLDGLLPTEPWTARLDELVAWRRWRRSARAVSVNASGQPAVRTDGLSPHPLVIEHGHRTLQVVEPTGGAPQ